MTESSWLRIALLIICAISVAAAGASYRLADGPFRSPLTAVAFVTTLLAAAATRTLALAPRRWLEFLAESVTRVDTWVRQTPIKDWKTGGLMLFAIATVSFLLITAWLALRQTEYETNGQAAYLQLARAVQEDGGPLATLKQLYRGTYVEANRHPLYPMILSMVDQFEAGKRLSIGLGLITIVTLTWIVAQRSC